jgi:hypothetical protein
MNLSEALTLFFLSCLERGTLDAALKEAGFKAVNRTNEAARIKEPADNFINVPIPFLFSANNRQRCHA